MIKEKVGRKRSDDEHVFFDILKRFANFVIVFDERVFKRYHSKHNCSHIQQKINDSDCALNVVANFSMKYRILFFLWNIEGTTCGQVLLKLCSSYTILVFMLLMLPPIQMCVCVLCPKYESRINL